MICVVLVFYFSLPCFQLMKAKLMALLLLVTYAYFATCVPAADDL